MKKSSWMLSAVLAVASLAMPAQAAPVNLGDPTGATQAAGTWYTDRYAPNGWSYNSGTGVLKETISSDDRASARDSSYASSFYNTQGRKYDIAGATMMSIELYVPGDLLNQRYAGFWGTGTNGSTVTGYPIIEFAADGSGPRVQGWDDNNGWVNYGLPSSFAYDAWHELKVVLDSANDQWDYSFDGTLLGSVDAFGATGLGNAILQGYNNFTDDQGSYDIRWRNLQANVPENNIPEPSSFALLAVAGIGLIASRSMRRKQPALAKW